ncbi:glycosyltransferase [Flavobacterium sp. UMI-01]|uniref:glycosyltransferase n=1 Tax=Flavobacterium sp. UMI-01 TaxID=1441053 RepID=UPI001C7D7937|nr:glycosyltransferase [Flavobacterium sp. UMI-01]
MPPEKETKTILIAILNWGLGHATRCIPIIQKLLEHHYTPLIASDGVALALLKKEFPNLQHLELPSYQIQYPQNKNHFKWKMIQKSPRMLAAIYKENQLIKEWIPLYQIDGVISDNRLGCYTRSKPCVYMTHQLNVFSGNTTWLSTKWHQYFIKKYDECWVPDYEDTHTLAGKLSHHTTSKLNIKYLNPLSRFEKQHYPVRYQLLIILSGPEPQRSMLESKLRNEIKKYNGKILFIQGLVTSTQTKQQLGNTTFYNYMSSSQLERAINESELVLCRSGYSSIMDLAQLEKKAFFIPTPGQFEQEYLAQHLATNKVAPYSNQDTFTIEDLNRTAFYRGFTTIKQTTNWSDFFSVFKKT